MWKNLSDLGMVVPRQAGLSMGRITKISSELQLFCNSVNHLLQLWWMEKYLSMHSTSNHGADYSDRRRLRIKLLSDKDENLRLPWAQTHPKKTVKDWKKLHLFFYLHSEFPWNMNCSSWSALFYAAYCCHVVGWLNEWAAWAPVFLIKWLWNAYLLTCLFVGVCRQRKRQHLGPVGIGLDTTASRVYTVLFKPSSHSCWSASYIVRYWVWIWNSQRLQFPADYLLPGNVSAMNKQSPHFVPKYLHTSTRCSD